MDMKKLLLLSIVFISINALAQTEKDIKQEVKIENTNGKYRVSLTTTENGESKTVTKTYNSLEEMKNDPEMAEIKMITLTDKGDNTFFFSDEPSKDDNDLKAIFRELGDGERHTDHDIKSNDDHMFIFKSAENGESEMQKIKVWVDEDGDKHISINGQEIDGDTWTDENGKTYNIKETDNKVMFLSDDQIGEFITDDGKHFSVRVKTNDGEGDTEMIIIDELSEDMKSDSDGEQKVVVRIVKDIKIHLKEVEDHEFNEMPGIDAKALKLNDLNYYPNPNNGRFTLAFQADNKPTEIRITGIDGKAIYSEKLQSFEGSYQKEIDLSGQKQGVYLLQILQGRKAINKKIVIE